MKSKEDKIRENIEKFEEEINKRKKLPENYMILNTIEVLIMTFFIMFLIPAYSLYYGRFFKVMTYAIIIAVIYYILKTIINIKKTRKQYYKNFNDIETIVAKK